MSVQTSDIRLERYDLPSKASSAAVSIGRIAIIAVPLLAWEAFSRFGLINGFLFPAPSLILQKLWIQSGSGGNPPFAILWHVAYSMMRLLCGIVLAVTVGTLFGVALGISRRVRLVFQPIISILIPVPTLAWTPVLLLVIGIDNRTTILVVFLAAVFEMIYIVSNGIEMMNAKMLWVAQSMGASRWQIFWRVIIPGIFPYLITGTRLGTGYAWRALIAAEMLAASTYGLGFMIYDASEYMNMDVIYGGVALIAILGYLLENVLIGKVEAATTEKWGVLNER